MKTFLRAYARIPTFLRNSPFEMFGMGIILAALVSVLVPTNFAITATDTSAQEKAIALEVKAMQNETVAYGVLPTADLKDTPDTVMHVTATAYNSLVGQTDSTPFITARGTHTRHGVIAANFVPFGTLIKIPAIYGDEIFVVEDRMNPRYTRRIDIWMEELADARKFGVKNIEIEVYYP